MMKIKITAVMALLLLAGCTSSKPGAFEKVDEDPAVNTVQYRFNPSKVDKTALAEDIAHYCTEKGFDKVEALPVQKSHVPGLMKTWYQCNYSIKS